MKVLTVCPCSSAETPDGSLLSYHLLLELSFDLPGSYGRRRVTTECCKTCANPHDTSDMPSYLPARQTKYDHNIVSKKSLSYKVNQGVVSALFQRQGLPKITDQQSVRGRGGVLVVLQTSHWVGLCNLSCEREMDFHL